MTGQRTLAKAKPTAAQIQPNSRQIYLTFPNRDALRRDLSWTHYRAIIRADNPQALMPTEAELQADLERDRALLEMNQP